MKRSPLFMLAALLVACGGGDSGTNTPPPEPVTSVQIAGTSRAKVGDSYAFTAESRTQAGTVVQRPVTWSIVETGKATVTSTGAVTPLQTGTITVRATVEGVSANASLDAYDWVPVVGSGVVGLGLAADNPISNKFGTSEFATLLMGCVSGNFVVGVATDHFVTASGAVSYTFDDGGPVADIWLESDDFGSLTYPGLTNLLQKSFATQLSGHSRFRFTFTEFQATAKQSLFRVTGLGGLLGPSLAACPSNSLQAGVRLVGDDSPLFGRLRAAAGR